MKMKYRSKKGAERASLVAIHAILIIISVIWLIPFLLMIILSFRGETVGTSADYIFPKQWSFNNYIKLFTETLSVVYPLAKRGFTKGFIYFTCKLSESS